MASALRAFGIIINDLCALSCRHCSLSYTDGYRGTKWQIGEAELRDAVRAAADGPYALVLMAGGEPALAPQLLRMGVNACCEHGILSAVVTAPVWAATPETAGRFLAKVEGLNILMLSYDRFHLEFLTLKHYANAAREAKRRGMHTFLNICYASVAEKTALTEDVVCLRNVVDQIHYQAVLPLGNATGINVEAIEIESEADILRLDRSCVAGNALLHRDGSVYACCWAARAKDSPLGYTRGSGGGVRSALAAMEAHSTFVSFSTHGPIDALSPPGRRRVAEMVRGKQFVNECDLCIHLMQQSASEWTEVFPGE
jgi:hypothetical protein